MHLPYLAEDASDVVVDRSLQRREAMINQIKLHLRRAQDRMTNQANKHRSDRKFEVGDWVWVKLQAYRQVSV